MAQPQFNCRQKDVARMMRSHQALKGARLKAKQKPPQVRDLARSQAPGAVQVFPCDRVERPI